MLHKPAGLLTTMSDPYQRPTVAELVPTDRYPGLFPIGRLDQDTTGLLLFSTDGDLGNHLIHPRHHVLKRYLAMVEGTPTEKQLDRLRVGITLDDGPTQRACCRAPKRAPPAKCWKSPTRPPARRGSTRLPTRRRPRSAPWWKSACARAESTR